MTLDWPLSDAVCFPVSRQRSCPRLSAPANSSVCAVYVERISMVGISFPGATECVVAGDCCVHREAT